ncbi:DNA methyltransferase [Marinobacter sp.]|uniref:Eco57I restriction-modification methylase domain-containing protein n=1 Tax=Marinobacter sp. TaxID=50741 RepID=UPI0023527FB7|nr:DNA methyltransferase [Marinobacter sp.]
MVTPIQHHDWLALIEISGPFLAAPVLKEAFPQGLEGLDGTKRKRLRQAYEEWREALETDDSQFDELHAAWINEVLAHGLELDEDGKADVLKRADWCAANLSATLPEHGVMLAPDLAVIDEQRGNKPLMLIQAYGQDVDLDATLKQDGWAATPADRMVQLCRAIGCRLGLVTNGERWMLVDAPVGAVTTFASWYARIWSQEPITLQAFVHLLGIRRFFVDEAEQLPALFDRSLKYQDEVTDALGEQVRRAVEVLIQALDKADQDRDRALLRDVKEPELYEAALTVMMRLVFLLSAEERGLLLLGDERYEANYALSTLRMQLRKESEEILERRWDAWSRLLAIFRAVFGGIEHENLRLPALGGSLFDPDRFPFLEGRAKGSDWRTDIAKPLPIDNRTVLLLLEAIQQFQGRTLSYRALDVEQIGYVYEGLLERTVKRTAEVTLELDGTKNAKAPWVKLAELESARLDGAECLAQLLQERSGSSASRVRKDLAKPVDDTLADRLLAACHGDTSLRNRIKPFAHLVRTDPWGYPLVYSAGAFIVTTGSDRRETGTHYTPKSLTEAIVAETLTPVAYVGPAEGTPREKWALKSPAELLDLKICDPAMGSGAFLVQACRWLADRLVESWSQAEGTGKSVSVDGEVLDAPDTKEPLPRDTEARTVIARRLIAERCLYGVDLNPLAVELAKLSIWLVTLAKGRPFGFLDHNLRCGDSLLGIHRLDQLTELCMTPTGKGQQRLFGQNIEQAVLEAIELRQRLREMPIRDIRDVESMARLDADARRKLEVPERIADAFIAEVLSSGGNANALSGAIGTLAIQAGQVIDGKRDAMETMTRRAHDALNADLPPEKSKRLPFHWPLEFPEIFVRSGPGFDVFIGNPPFLGGKKIAAAMGRKYLNYLISIIGHGVKGSADLVAFFFLRSASLLKNSKTMGMIASNSISEGGTREVGLEQLKKNGFEIYQAINSEIWPGSANVVTSRVYLIKGAWLGEKILNGDKVEYISPYLTSRDNWEPVKLTEATGRVYQGSVLLGSGFIIDKDDAQAFLTKNHNLSKVIYPYLSGQDVNRSPSHESDRWVINFWDWPKEKAEAFSPELFSILEKKVIAERSNMKSMGGAVETFWRHLWCRSELYHWLGYGALFDEHPAEWRPHDIAPTRVMVFATGATKYPCFTFVPNIYIYANTLCVIASESYSLFACLSSDIHTIWAWEHGSRMKQDLRYTHGDIFETFPFPAGALDASNQALSDFGERFFDLRSKYMVANNKGMTKFYNDLHDPLITSAPIEELRELHIKINLAVIHAYGFSDLDLGHDFHEVAYLPEGKNIRFTISETAREELLYRLALLNRARSEVEQGAASERVTGKAARRPVVSAEARQSGLFDRGEP